MLLAKSLYILGHVFHENSLVDQKDTIFLCTKSAILLFDR